ncbi:MAG: dethiobiotin synthase [Gemmatimonadales bacterium]|nr:dethiobiotin synthase [Gemmatimonadales bacterium]
MSSIVVVTGTDTGVGKTWVTAALAAACCHSGRDVRAVKLVETGTAELSDEGEDGVQLARATRQAAPMRALRRYRTPVAAAEAAEREGFVFDLPAAIEEVREIAAGAELTLVEGAGGLLAPLTWRETLLDVARTLAAPVLLVAADRLGTLNHTLLTLAALEHSGTPCLGVVMNALPFVGGGDASRGGNAEALRRVRTDIRVTETERAGWAREVMEWVG